MGCTHRTNWVDVDVGVIDPIKDISYKLPFRSFLRPLENLFQIYRHTNGHAWCRRTPKPIRSQDLTTELFETGLEIGSIESSADRPPNWHCIYCAESRIEDFYVFLRDLIESAKIVLPGGAEELT